MKSDAVQSTRTRGVVEAEVNEVTITVEKAFMGRCLIETKPHIFDDVLLIRLKVGK